MIAPAGRSAPETAATIGDGNGRVLNIVVAAYFVVMVMSWRVEGLQINMMALVGEGFLRDLRKRVFDHLLRLSMPYYDRESSGVVVSRMAMTRRPKRARQ